MFHSTRNNDEGLYWYYWFVHESGQPMSDSDKITYITDDSAPYWRVRIHMMASIDFIYVTLQSASIRGGDTNTTTWLDSWNHYKKFAGDQMFDALCYAYALLKEKGRSTMEQANVPLQEHP